MINTQEHGMCTQKFCSCSQCLPSRGGGRQRLRNAKEFPPIRLVYLPPHGSLSLWFFTVAISPQQGVTTALSTPVKRLWGKTTSLRFPMGWTVLRTGCRWYGKRAWWVSHKIMSGDQRDPNLHRKPLPHLTSQDKLGITLSLSTPSLPAFTAPSVNRWFFLIVQFRRWVISLSLGRDIGDQSIYTGSR